MKNEALRATAHKAIVEGNRAIADFYRVMRAAGHGGAMFLDAQLEQVGIVKDLGGGYFRFNTLGPVAPYHLTMKSVSARIEESTVNLGSGSCSRLSPVITPEGRAQGWIYTYPVGINRDGINFTKLDETLDTLEAAGLIELQTQVHTAV